MKRYSKLISLEWKRALKVLPLMLAETLILCVFLGMFLFLCQKLFFTDSFLQRIPIGLVMEEENKMTELALSYLEGMESISSACEFRKMSPEEGQRALERGEIAALMVLPEEMMEAILDSRNYPVKVYFPRNSSLGALLIKELTDAGAGMLSVAQAEIYAAYDMNFSLGNLEELSKLEKDINLFNMKFAMARERLIRIRTLQISEEIPLLTHYLASGITLLLMLWGIACGRFLKGDNQAFGRQLLRAGVRRWQWMLAKLSGTLLVLGIGAICIFGLLAVLRPKLGMPGMSGMPGMPGIEAGITAAGLPGLAVMLLCIAALLLFCYQAAPGRSSGMILIFIITIVIIFVSGGFIPAVFLPESLNSLAKWLPGNAFIQVIASLLGAFDTGSGLQSSLLVLLAWSGLFYLASLLINMCKREAD